MSLYKIIAMIIVLVSLTANPSVADDGTSSSAWHNGPLMDGPPSFPPFPPGRPFVQRQQTQNARDPNQSILSSPSSFSQRSILGSDDRPKVPQGAAAFRNRFGTGIPAFSAGSSSPDGLSPAGQPLPSSGSILSDPMVGGSLSDGGGASGKLPERFSDIRNKFQNPTNSGSPFPGGDSKPPFSTTTDTTDGSPIFSKNGCKLQHKADGSTVFTRSNGIETEMKDGRVRMKQDGQYTIRELKF